MPIKHPTIHRIESKIVQLLKIFLELLTIAEWNKAVANSQGTNEEFSTGSQNHQPPQPNS